METDASIEVRRKVFMSELEIKEPTFTDISGKAWNQEELQALVLALKSFKKTALRLGKPSGEVNAALRLMKVYPPAEFVRKIALASPELFKETILRESRKRGWKGVSDYYGCSVAHLINVMEEVGIKYKTNLPTKETVVAAMNRFGSAIMAARLLNCTVNDIKKIAPEWKEMRDPLLVGRTATATGRTGEIYWQRFRGDKTTEHTCMVDHNAPDYDFIDSELGSVNVKTASVEKQKDKEIYCWTWQVSSEQKADCFPLVLLNRDCQPFAHILIKRNERGELIFHPLLRVKVWANGAYGLSFKANSDRPEISGMTAILEVLDSTPEEAGI